MQGPSSRNSDRPGAGTESRAVPVVWASCGIRCSKGAMYAERADQPRVDRGSCVAARNTTTGR